MMPNRDWLWDRNITGRKVKAVLTHPNDRQFLSLVSILLARKNTPKEVFKDYLKPVDFLKNWNSIKRQMRKDSWNNPRIEFWQAIYEKLKEKYKKNGAFLIKQTTVTKPEDEFCKLIADKIKVVRKQKGLTQSALAKRLKVSQQMVSRIEKGRENISLLTLKNIVDSLGGQVTLDIF